MKSAFWLTSLAQVPRLTIEYPAGQQVLPGAMPPAAVVSLRMVLFMTAFGGFRMVAR